VFEHSRRCGIPPLRLAFSSFHHRMEEPPWREQKPVSIFAIFAVLYSTVAVALQHALSADQSFLTSEYLGQPVFGDVTLSWLSLRISALEVREMASNPGITSRKYTPRYPML
jgi:hypothetical protein